MSEGGQQGGATTCVVHVCVFVCFVCAHACTVLTVTPMYTYRVPRSGVYPM